MKWIVGIKIGYLQACTSAEYVVVCRVLSVVILEKETTDRRSQNRVNKKNHDFWTLFYSLDKKISSEIKTERRYNSILISAMMMMVSILLPVFGLFLTLLFSV